MDNETLLNVIHRVLHQVSFPLSVHDIAYSVAIMSSHRLKPSTVKQALANNKRRFKSLAGHYYLAECEEQVMTNALISKDYQKLGLEVRRFNKSFVIFVKKEAEHRFICFGTSSVPGAGLGAFVREGRNIRGGTIICEYCGRKRKGDPPSTALYAVAVCTGEYIDGQDDNGDILSLAALINDNGPAAANASLQEFTDGYYGRAFIVATRDLYGGEELFLRYGAKYWGGMNYDSIKVHTPKTPVANNDWGNDSNMMLTRCRDCDSLFPKRVKALHYTACSDPLTRVVPKVLDPLPLNQFTAVDVSGTGKRINRSNSAMASIFVNESKFTLSNTHESVEHWNF
eukprot:Tbor_TRINITY_DN3692_c0_g1::TRINITY_DN3692_c0_g1_i1::g.275::m.275